jgi:hypothetical protein
VITLPGGLPKVPRWVVWVVIVVVVVLWLNVAGGGGGGAGGTGSGGGSGGSGSGGGSGGSGSGGSGSGSGSTGAGACDIYNPVNVYHVEFTTGIPESGAPVVTDDFPVGTPRIYALLDWACVPSGTDFGLTVERDGEPVLPEVHHVVRHARRLDTDKSQQFVGAAVPLEWAGGWPAGVYGVRLTFNGAPDQLSAFNVGGTGVVITYGSGTDTGPIAYKPRDQVLVLTNSAVLRQHLGSDVDAVLAAASNVGTLVDMAAASPVVSTATGAAELIRPYLAGGQYRYLLILGNDDAVPFFQLPNPVTGEEVLNNVVDVPSDDPYTDLDRDSLGVPDFATARIPSSDDATLIRTQLGEATPPDARAAAVVNQQRQREGGAVLDALSTGRAVDVAFAPPLTPDVFAGSTAQNARYLYVLLHGGPKDTTYWGANVEQWLPLGGDNPPTSDAAAAEWAIDGHWQDKAIALSDQLISHGIVEVGACFGAWTMPIDGVTKSASNSLALRYLKSGARAFVADTHLSYSSIQKTDGLLRGRTGFEVAFWEAINGGNAPIDAFLIAKQRISESARRLQALGDSDAAITEKTIHYMIYLGRP